MADSIIMRGQAMAKDQSDSSSLLQVGAFQTALLDLIESPSGRYMGQDWETYIVRSTDSVVGVVGNATEDTQYPLDRLSVGNGLFYLYDKTGKMIYKKTLAALHTSIDLQPRNQFGGLWYYVYPYWSYLDGMFSLLSFYPSYAAHFDIGNTTMVNNDLFHQLELLWEHCHDNKTGLLFHGYDATKSASWANSTTGASPVDWARALGWFMMALVDFLELSPEHPMTTTWRARFVDLANAVVQAADPASGCWWQVMSAPRRKSNYIESSASAMFTYTLYKGVRVGLLQEHGTDYASVAGRAYRSLVDGFVVENRDGSISYNGTVGVCSLNSTATYEYYVTQPLKYDSVLGSAAFVRASIEHELRSGPL
ncbi:Six-hairpin glycosidase-like protein [Aspergillus undulatus]|uniref:Six-hairpin glycosidase-like protein n=1 Tax=Aspergillus undulatus TaxID=1810928 RepID=UPI003CCCF546